jgi:hypothetical protein
MCFAKLTASPLSSRWTGSRTAIRFTRFTSSLRKGYAALRPQRNGIGGTLSVVLDAEKIAYRLPDFSKVVWGEAIPAFLSQ